MRLRAEVLAVFACNQLGRGASAGGRAVRALRAAQAAGAQITERLVRVELAACAADASAPAIALALLQPVLSTRRRVAPTARAAALVTAADGLAKLGGGPEVAALLTAADRLYDASRAVEPDAVLLRRGVVHGRLAAHHRRVGSHASAEQTARGGLALLDELSDNELETGQVSGALTLELILALLDAGREAEAVLAAQSVLRRSVRPAGAPAACWLRLALASRVHVPAGRYPLARRLLGDAAFTAERHQLDAGLAECRQLQAQLHERCAEFGEALENLRAAQLAERRWRDCAGELRTLLAAEFGAPPPAAELRAELAAVVANASAVDQRTSDRPARLAATGSRHATIGRPLAAADRAAPIRHRGAARQSVQAPEQIPSEDTRQATPAERAQPSPAAVRTEGSQRTPAAGSAEDAQRSPNVGWAEGAQRPPIVGWTEDVQGARAAGSTEGVQGPPTAGSAEGAQQSWAAGSAERARPTWVTRAAGGEQAPPAAGSSEGTHRSRAVGSAEDAHGSSAAGSSEGARQSWAAGSAEGVRRSQAWGLTGGGQESPGVGSGEGARRSEAEGLAEGMQGSPAVGSGEIGQRTSGFEPSTPAAEAGRAAGDEQVPAPRAPSVRRADRITGPEPPALPSERPAAETAINSSTSDEPERAARLTVPEQTRPAHAQPAAAAIQQAPSETGQHRAEYELGVSEADEGTAEPALGDAESDRGTGRHRSDVALADLLAEAMMAYQNGRRSRLAAAEAVPTRSLATSAEIEQQPDPSVTQPTEMPTTPIYMATAYATSINTGPPGVAQPNIPRPRLIDLPREQVWREPGTF